MELKLSKRLVFTSMEFKNGNPRGLQFIEKEGYFLTKEELEKVITDAWVKGWDNYDGSSKINLEQYLNSILK